MSLQITNEKLQIVNRCGRCFDDSLRNLSGTTKVSSEERLRG